MTFGNTLLQPKINVAVGVGKCLVLVRITRHIKGNACCVVFVFMQQKIVVKLTICCFTRLFPFAVYHNV